MFTLAAAKAAATLSFTSWSSIAWLTLGGAVVVALAGPGLARVALVGFFLGGILLQTQNEMKVNNILKECITRVSHHEYDI